MKITIVQGAFLPVPPTQGGAVEKLWFQLGKALSSMGVQVTHISSIRPTDAADHSDDSLVRRIRVRGFRTNRSALVCKLFDLIYSLRVAAVLPQADVLITNTFFLPILPIPRSRGRLYVSVHRMPRSQYKLYRNVARYQCVSTAVANALARALPSASDKVTVIPNFVTLPATATTAQERYSASTKTILFVGRLHEEKGVHCLIESFAKATQLHRQWQLKIVGPHQIELGGGGDKYFERLQRLSSPISALVEFTGAIFDDAALSAIYQSAAVFVYPSLAERGEAFGLAPLEAMAYGVPALVSHLDCFADFVSPWQNGWIADIRDAMSRQQRLTDALVDACVDLDARPAAYAANALSTAAQFSLASVAAKLLEDLNMVAAGNGT